MRNPSLFFAFLLLIGCGIFENNDKEDNQKVCLTIDDKITNGMLDTLKKYDVTVMFFPVAAALDQEIFARAKQQGHDIGNHIYTPNVNLRYLSHAQQLEEVRKADEALGINTVVLRPPYHILQGI